MAVSDRIAVMSAGEVVQEGTAEDLYHRPASEFVAQFIGRVNLLAGRVVDAAGATVTVDAAGVRLRAFHTSPLRAGEAVRLAIRPEAIALAPDDPGAEGEVVGTIVTRAFLGEKVDYTVRAGAQSFLVTRYNPGPGAVLEEGQRVRLDLSSDAVQILPLEG
jgi:ABC-type Fe3+/spermidine/putrescine transport system ATPase subunit